MSWDSGAIVIGCRDVTADFIDRLIRNGKKVSGIVTISEKSAKANKVPTWIDLEKEFFSSDIPVYVADNYNLVNEHLLKTAKSDVGFCIGWQRLLPQWFLDTCKNGVYGTHACANRLPNGRGRSPINWSLIEGAESLYVHIFKYNDQPDAGELFDAPLLKIMPDDDINTLQHKAMILFNQAVCVISSRFNSFGSNNYQCRPWLP